MSEPQSQPFDPNQRDGATPPVPHPYADQPPAYGSPVTPPAYGSPVTPDPYGAPVTPAPYGAPVAPAPYGAVPPSAPPIGLENPYGAPSPYATGPAAQGIKQPNSWRVYASFALSAVAFLFFPLVGLAGIALASLAMQRNEKLGRVALIVAIACMVVGWIIGAVIRASM